VRDRGVNRRLQFGSDTIGCSGGFAGRISPDGDRLVVGGGFGNVLRAEDRNDYHDLGLVAYDIAPKVVSRKVHGSAGTFDVDLPLSVNPGIESRGGGPNGDYSLVFTFANDLIAVADASASGCGGSVSSSAKGPNANQYSVNLTGVSNACYVTVTLTNVLDAAGNLGSVSVPMGVLLGDVNSNRTVSNGDVASIQAQVGATVGQTNFRNDVNANGTLSNGDVATTQTKVGTQLP
jgi:hypothetical protein